MDITQIIIAAFGLIGTVTSIVLLPYIRSKTTTEQQQSLNYWIRVAVKAAEQLYVGTSRGVEKKNYVLNFLEEHDLTIDEEKIDTMIEAAVYEINKGLI